RSTTMVAFTSTPHRRRSSRSPSFLRRSSSRAASHRPRHRLRSRRPLPGRKAPRLRAAPGRRPWTARRVPAGRRRVWRSTRSLAWPPAAACTFTLDVSSVRRDGQATRERPMLDPGRYLAEAIYFLQYTLAQILWAIDRAALSIAIIAESVNGWLSENIGYFVELLVNALSAPLGGLLILALTALGFWYVLNTIVATSRWVDPSRLFTYGLIALFFFSAPLVVVELMEELRAGINAGIDQALVDGASGDIFNSGLDGTDTGLPAAIPDVNGDGVVASFDMVAAFLLV